MLVEGYAAINPACLANSNNAGMLLENVHPLWTDAFTHLVHCCCRQLAKQEMTCKLQFATVMARTQLDG